MTDQIFYEELRATVRDAIASYLDTYTDEELRELATESLSLPSRPTLADMTEEERAACQWMQADVIVGHDPLVITHIERSDGTATILDRNGRYDGVPAEEVTPRPDLPRMTWPGDTPVAPDHLAVGTVIESADDPRIDALPLGTILLDRNEEATTKRPQPWGWTGLGNTPAEEEGDEPGPWTVLHIPKEADQ